MTQNKKHILTRKIRQLRALIQTSGNRIETLVGTILFDLCFTSYAGLPSSGLPASNRLANKVEIKSFVADLVAMPLLEAAYWLSSLYAISSDGDYRKSLAMFFTPPSITKRLLDDLAINGVEFDEGTFCDPTCGGAAFLAPIALRMKERLKAKGVQPRDILEHIRTSLYGTDLDPVLCKLSHHFLLMALHEEVLAADYVPSFQIKQGNALLDMQSALGSFDVIACNPPFRKMAAAEVGQYRSLFADVIEAQPNIYALFMGLSVGLLKPDGIAALVTPTSYLSGQNFRKLRTFLLSQVKVLNIGMVGDRLGVFIDVEQETALTLVRRKETSEARSMQSAVSVVATDGQYSTVGACLLPNSGATWPIPRTEADAALLLLAGREPARLTDYGYRIRIGTFVWNRDKRPVFESHAEVKKRKAKSAVPLLWSSDIGSNRKLLFDLRAKSSDEHRFVDFGAKAHPGVVSQPSVILQRVTSNNQPRRLVGAPVPQALLDQFGGYVGENHTVILEQNCGNPALTPAELAELLATPTVDRYFRCISGSTNVSAFELGQLVLPSPQKIRRLIDREFSMEEAVHNAFYSSH